MPAFVAPDDFQPDFAKSGGLIAAIAQDWQSQEILMLAWMDQAAWQATLNTGEAHYFSRSRNKLWHKGESSGHVQKVKAIRLDCDKDAIVLLIEQIGGAACHTGHCSCFYRQLDSLGQGLCSPLIFDPQTVYN